MRIEVLAQRGFALALQKQFALPRLLRFLHRLQNVRYRSLRR